MTQIQTSPAKNCRLLCAPAGAGKTRYAIALCRAAAARPGTQPRVVVPTHLQARAWRQRLAEAGGALGVRVLTFDGLYAEVLNAAGAVYTELSDAVQYRLLRATLDTVALDYYAPLRRRPGFIRAAQTLIREFQAAHIMPQDLLSGIDRLSEVAAAGMRDRWHVVRELAQIYAAYQQALSADGWTDRPGVGWLAAQTLESRPETGADWPLLVIDGFDDFSAVQIDVIRTLAARAGQTVITLTGCPDDRRRGQVHRRFVRTERKLAQALGLSPTPVPAGTPPGSLPTQPPGTSEEPVFHPVPRHPELGHLEANLLEAGAARVPSGGAVELLEAPDRAGEVRAALRWLKQRLVLDDVQPGDVALLARSIEPYRPFILETAAEFGLRIHVVDGPALGSNPAIAALLDLLKLALPSGQAAGEPALPYRLVIEAWLSPYFDWSAHVSRVDPTQVGIRPGDGAALDAAARWGRVTGGLAQWTEVLGYLAARRDAEAGAEPGSASRASTPEEDERGLAPGVPTGAAAEDLLGKFLRFVRRLAPPQGLHAYRDFVGWLEALIGSDPGLGPARFPLAEEPTTLGIVACARRPLASGSSGLAQNVTERDVAALHCFKEILAALVWAEQALGTPPVDYSAFVGELAAAVEATAYQLPLSPAQDAILVADVVQARGLTLRAVALVGLAEGEFPAVLAEDPFLRDAERATLTECCGLPLDPSLAGSEAEYFYEAITRPRERLLLTRPRLADNGSAWQASPFWDDVLGLLDVAPTRLAGDRDIAPEQSASYAELLERLALLPPGARSGPLAGAAGDRQAGPALAAWQEIAERQALMEAGAGLVRQRSQRRSAGSPHDGALQAQAGWLAERLGPDREWSASRLEQYGACPFYFFTASLLGLQPRETPGAGLDVRQRGNLYHRILARLYDTAPDPGDLDGLLAALPTVAAEILDAAPQHEGFRATAWWAHTRAEMTERVEATVIALTRTAGGFVPIAHERRFFGRAALTVRDGADSFRVHGVIDRVDRAPDGRLRIIDYKSGSVSAYSRRAVAEGSKLQLVLYAAAAQGALELGEVADGFYWSLMRAEASPYRLAEAEGGVAGAVAAATARAWRSVRAARSGVFEPAPPADGCPPYCPAAAFCWHYEPGFGGD